MAADLKIRPALPGLQVASWDMTLEGFLGGLGGIEAWN
jgi:hypothetical protein